MPEARTHDPKLCGQHDTDGCTCPCAKCATYRETAWAIKRRGELEARLAKAGINVEDFADMIWIRLEPAFEARIEKMVRDVLRRNLKGLKLQSAVWASSVDWQE